MTERLSSELMRRYANILQESASSGSKKVYDTPAKVKNFFIKQYDVTKDMWSKALPRDHASGATFKGVPLDDLLETLKGIGFEVIENQDNSNFAGDPHVTNPDLNPRRIILSNGKGVRITILGASTGTNPKLDVSVQKER